MAGLNIKTVAAALLLLIVLLPAQFIHADTDKLIPLKGSSATVYHPKGMEADAGDVLDVFALALEEINADFGLTLDYNPAIVIITDKDAFNKSVGSEHISAYTVGEKGLIVMNYSRVLTSPFTLKGTLKHEAVHLVLSKYIGRGNIPRWLNEGMAQLIAQSPAEVVLSRNASALIGAVLSGRLIRLDDIARGFPGDRRAMVLAYEESRSFVQFLDSEFGRNALLEILASLRQGADISTALKSATGQGLYELEVIWRDKLWTTASWFSYLSNHFYELLFMLAALITVIGFLKTIIRIRTYKDDDDEGSQTL